MPTKSVPFKVRDLRRKEKSFIDDDYINGWAKYLKPATTAVYISLCRHADKEQSCFPAHSLIAAEHGINRRTVQEKIKLLEECNIIQRKKIRRKNGTWLNTTYFLVDKSEWTNPWEKVGKEKGKVVKGCLLCGSLVVDKCHVIPKSKGGLGLRGNIIYLCPNHHRLFDRGKLEQVNLEKIAHFLIHGKKLPIVKQETSMGKKQHSHGKIFPTKDTHKKVTHIYNNAPALEKADIVENLLKETDKGGIKYDFQYLGLNIFEKANAPKNKKAECIRIAKIYPSGSVNTALSFAIDYPNQKLKWKMFLWKLNQLRKDKKSEKS